ncbi:hypothetical protein [Geobacter sulfurreducens]|uniref:hypothetical protein n=1 Tax=Geobacter sulfurreducens TaxID=35554 RepID=UPI002D184B4F|nr:hypothetical protein [Geobacter sulfurreducens]HML78688.1 hypothetical protein [Geobacter sulfurreducens]
MGIFDIFKKSQPAAALPEPDMQEIMRCYFDLHSDISSKLNATEGTARATLLGSEIPVIAQNDLGNFNTLLYNSRRPEVKEKAFDFWIEQATFYVMYTDRYLFSKFGNEKRTEIMEDIETGYLNAMIIFAKHNEEMWHFARRVLIEREKESAHCDSLQALQNFHYAKCLERVGLKEDYFINRTLLDHIVSASTMNYSIRALPSLFAAYE